MEEIKKLYRHELQFPDVDEYGSEVEELKIILHEFDVVRKTKRGVWIRGFIKNKWVSNSSRKRFAYPTINESLNYFIQRKKSHANHLSYRLRINKQAIEKAKQMINN